MGLKGNVQRVINNSVSHNHRGERGKNVEWSQTKGDENDF